MLVFEMIASMVSLYGVYVGVFVLGVWRLRRIRSRAAEDEARMKVACRASVEELMARVR